MQVKGPMKVKGPTRVKGPTGVNFKQGGSQKIFSLAPLANLSPFSPTLKMMAPPLTLNESVKTPVHKKRFIYYQNVQFFNRSKNCCFVCDHI